jgi:hypothetical protein
MLTQKQIHDKACLQACIANLLEIPVNDVPDFSKFHGLDYDKDKGFPPFWIEVQDFVKRYGYVLLEIALKDELLCEGCQKPQLHDRAWTPLPGKFECIIIGHTAGGLRHAINGFYNGRAFEGVFCPFSGGRDLDSVQHLVEAVAVCVLVPITPKELRIQATLREIESKSVIVLPGTLNALPAESILRNK